MAMIYLVYFFLFVLWNSCSTFAQSAIYLTAEQTVTYTPNEYDRRSNQLRIYCYEGKPYTVLRFFETIELRLSIENDDYQQYKGHTPHEVGEHYENDRSMFSISLFAQKRSRLPLSPFEDQCIGISTMQPYSVHLSRAVIDFWRVVQLLLGVILFISARSLSDNRLFYYISGVLVGVCASFLLLLLLVAKLFPRRPMMYGMLLGGWTIGVYLLKLLADNLQLILVTYREYVFWYIFITGVISFLVCYRFGPPSNRRSKNIIMWVLQLIAAIFMYFSSRFEAAAVSVVLIVVVTHYFPRSLLRRLSAFFRRRFPKRRRLLSLEEFRKQGIEETNKSLAELREFVNSPKCKQWKVMTALADPARFANFANGANHLADDEIEQYTTYNEEDINSEDDSDDAEDSENPRLSRLQLGRSINPVQQRSYIKTDADYAAAATHETDDEDEEYESYCVARAADNRSLRRQTTFQRS